MAPRQPTDYFAAALELMASGGAAQVTIDNLCEMLQVTKGSFYHHFEGRPDFVRQVLLYWEDAHARSLAAEALTVADPRRRIGVLADLAIGLNHDAERAIRRLAATDLFADEVRHRVDTARFAVVARTLLDAGMPPDAADQMAEVGVALLVGAQEMGAGGGRDRVAAVLAPYQRWLEAELARPGLPSADVSIP